MPSVLLGDALLQVWCPAWSCLVLVRRCKPWSARQRVWEGTAQTAKQLGVFAGTWASMVDTHLADTQGYAEFNKGIGQVLVI